MTWKERMEDAKDRLARVNAVLKKRKARVAYCKEKVRYWDAKFEAAWREKRWDNAERARRKRHYWAEQLDKAVLGKKDYEARRQRLLAKIEYLQDHRPAPAPSTDGVSVPDAPWNPLKRQISNSLVPWLNKGWDNGWRGQVTSGYRSPEYQCEVCKQVCGNCNGCPGTCAAPGTSNHQRYGPGQGAVDVSDYYTFGAIMRRIGAPIFNALGAQDPVHFSFTGR